MGIGRVLTKWQHEMMRINDLHNVLMLALNNRLLPPELTRPRKILELGVGTGDWAVEVAKTYPACEVCVFISSMFRIRGFQGRPDAGVRRMTG